MKKWILVVAALAGLFYWTWTYVSTPWGDQKVDYVPAKQECSAAVEKTAFRYCVHTAVQGVNGDVAYFLHGRNLDEQIWNDDTFYTAMIQKYWAEQNVKPPTVVTISFGPIWLLAQKNSAERSGLLEVFLNEVIATVEKKTGEPRRRIVFGESMGGLNTALLVLRSPKTFVKAAMICPGLYKGSPFDSLSAFKDMITRTGAKPTIIFGIRKLAQMHFPTARDWDETAPFKLLETVDVQAMPELFLTNGLYDAYGNFEGTEAFAKRAIERGIKTKWRPAYGGHCAIDIPSVADFLVE
ncbi:MAG: alpha/beta hydrolase-fold protein [Bdellovibrionota bacterium]